MKVEPAPFTLVGGQVAAPPPREIAADRETESCSLSRPVGVHGQLKEWIEDRLELVRRDPDAAIGHANAQRARVAIEIEMSANAITPFERATLDGARLTRIG